jgi:hypothetical protein
MNLTESLHAFTCLRASATVRLPSCASHGVEIRRRCTVETRGVVEHRELTAVLLPSTTRTIGTSRHGVDGQNWRERETMHDVQLLSQGVQRASHRSDLSRPTRIKKEETK